MKGFVDKDTCIGCGLCEAVCPKAFRMTDDGVAEGLDYELAGSDLDEARDAEAQCPVEAITIE